VHTIFIQLTYSMSDAVYIHRVRVIFCLYNFAKIMLTDFRNFFTDRLSGKFLVTK